MTNRERLDKKEASHHSNDSKFIIVGLLPHIFNGHKVTKYMNTVQTAILPVLGQWIKENDCLLIITYFAH